MSTIENINWITSTSYAAHMLLKTTPQATQTCCRRQTHFVVNRMNSSGKNQNIQASHGGPKRRRECGDGLGISSSLIRPTPDTGTAGLCCVGEQIFTNKTLQTDVIADWLHGYRTRLARKLKLHININNLITITTFSIYIRTYLIQKSRYQNPLHTWVLGKLIDMFNRFNWIKQLLHCLFGIFSFSNLWGNIHFKYSSITVVMFVITQLLSVSWFLKT